MSLASFPSRLFVRLNEKHIELKAHMCQIYTDIYKYNCILYTLQQFYNHFGVGSRLTRRQGPCSY